MLNRLSIITGLVTGIDWTEDGHPCVINIKPAHGKPRTIYIPSLNWATPGTERELAADAEVTVEGILDFCTPVSCICIQGEEDELICREIWQGAKRQHSLQLLADDGEPDDDAEYTNTPEREPERPRSHHKHHARYEEWSENTENGCGEW